MCMNFPVQNSLVPSFHCLFLPFHFLSPMLPPSHLPLSLSPSPLPPSLPPSGVIDSRRSSQQVLDHLPVERERGITVKAQTASMVYHWQGQQFLLNLIDTPVGPPSLSCALSPSLQSIFFVHYTHVHAHACTCMLQW